MVVPDLAHDAAVALREARVPLVLLTTEQQLLRGDFATDFDIATRSPACYPTVVSALEEAGICVLSSWSDWPGSRAFLCARADLSDSVILDVQTDRWGGGLYRLSFDSMLANAHTGAATGLPYLDDECLSALRRYKAATKPASRHSAPLIDDDTALVLRITRLRDQRALARWLSVARLCNRHRRIQKLIVWALFPWLLIERVVAPIGMVVRLPGAVGADPLDVAELSDRLEHAFGAVSVHREPPPGDAVAAATGRARLLRDYGRGLTLAAVVRVERDSTSTPTEMALTRSRHRHQRRVRPGW